MAEISGTSEGQSSTPITDRINRQEAVVTEAPKSGIAETLRRNLQGFFRRGSGPGAVPAGTIINPETSTPLQDAARENQPTKR